MYYIPYHWISQIFGDSVSNVWDRWKNDDDNNNNNGNGNSTRALNSHCIGIILGFVVRFVSLQVCIWMFVCMGMYAYNMLRNFVHNLHVNVKQWFYSISYILFSLLSVRVVCVVCSVVSNTIKTSVHVAYNNCPIQILIHFCCSKFSTLNPFAYPYLISFVSLGIIEYCLC